MPPPTKRKKLIYEETAPHTAIKFFMELEEITLRLPRGPYIDPTKKLIYEETAPHTTMKLCMELEGNISV